MSGPNGVSALMRGMQRGVIAMLLVLLIYLLPTVLGSASSYRPFPVELAAYGAMLLLALAGAALALIGRPIGGGRWWLPMMLVVIASLAATFAVPAEELLSPVHWSWRVVGWFAVLLLLDRPVPVVMSVLAGLLLLVVAHLALTDRLDRESVVQLIIIETLNTGTQVTYVLGAKVVRRVGESAHRIATREADLRTASLIADQALADRQARYADIADTTVPLLEGLRDGRLRPGDPDTRLRCAIEAARLRRLMAEGDDVLDPLVHELRACVDVAERTGVQVDMAVRGTGPRPGPAVRRCLTEPVIATLARARSHARLTVVAAERDVVVSLVADIHPDTEPASHVDAVVTEPDVELNVVRLPDRIWLTATWSAA